MIASQTLNLEPGYLIGFLVGTLQGIAEMVANVKQSKYAGACTPNAVLVTKSSRD
jgi:hypothetical protein